MEALLQEPARATRPFHPSPPSQPRPETQYDTSHLFYFILYQGTLTYTFVFGRSLSEIETCVRYCSAKKHVLFWHEVIHREVASGHERLGNGGFLDYRLHV